MRTTLKKKLSAIALITVAVVFCGVMSGFTVSGAIAAISGTDNGIHYYNDDVQDDGIDNDNYNFGPDRYTPATEAVSAGSATSVEDYIAKTDGTGDFFTSIAEDPALCAAIAVDMDNRLAFNDPILVDEQNVLIGQRADAAHKHFLADQTYWDSAVSLIKQRLTSGSISIVSIDTYTSAMYQIHNGLDGNKPSVVVRNTTNAGGHFVQFDLGKPGIVKYRLECGYQPVDVSEYWPVPDKPSVPDNPTPTPGPTPTPTPTLEPKDPDGGPQGQITDPAAAADFGGGQNHDNDTTVTSEPSSPNSYTAPSAPAAEPSGSSGSSTSSSGSQTVDKTNGTTESHNGSDYNVVSGDGQSHTDLGEVQQNQNSGTVEKPVQGDGTNQGDIAAPE